MRTQAIPSLKDIDCWLDSRERKVPGLKPGVEAAILWASPEKTRTSVSIVYLPGYTATRGEISPAPERIARALGANLYFSRPQGQGVGPEGHREVTLDDWVNGGLEALEIGRVIGNQVVVMGTSTGGTLATWLQLGPTAATVAASILVSPNLSLVNKASELLLWPGKELWRSLLIGPWVRLKPQNELQDRFWDLKHHSHSLIPMMQLVQLARNSDFARWSKPALVITDPKDDVVDSKVTYKLFSKANPSLISFHSWKAAPGDNHHVLAGDALSPNGTDAFVSLATDYLRDTLRNS